MTSMQRTRTHRTCQSIQPVAWMPRPRVHPDPADPWRVVERRQQGLLRYARARGTMALPVRYGVGNHRVYIRLPAYNDACHFVDRAEVALDVEVATVGRLVIVRVAGVGLLIPETMVPEDISRLLDDWPPHVHTSTMVLVPESVHWLGKPDELQFRAPSPNAGLPGTFVDRG
jgi:hypothetical protein